MPIGLDHSNSDNRLLLRETFAARRQAATPTPTDPARAQRVSAELSRFVMVGFLNTAVDLLVLNLLIGVTHTGRSGFSYSGLKTISFLVALLNSYFLNRNWTFPRRAAKSRLKQASQFVMVSLSAALVNVTAASYVATFVAPLRRLEWCWPSLAALVGTGAAFVLNFVGYKYLVFSARPGLVAAPESEQ